MLNFIHLFPLYDIFRSYQSIQQGQTIINQAEAFKSCVIEENEGERAILDSLKPVCSQYKIENLYVERRGSLDFYCPAASCGGTLVNKNIIIIDPSLLQEDIETAKVLSKHELGHLVHNDLIKEPVLLSVCSIACSIFLTSKKITGFKGYLIGSITLLAFHLLLSRFSENKADEFAINHSTLEELKGGIRFYKAVKKFEKQFVKTYPFTARMNFLFSTHPSTESRLLRFKNVYFIRTGNCYEPSEREYNSFYHQMCAFLPEMNK